VLQHPDAAPHPLPTGTRITQVYDAADGELLLLGAPGSGKTTLLLELARDLLARAQTDEQHPMPVVFNLSSWAMKQLPLVDWLVDELNTKYQVPSKLAQALLSTDQILPLLDGLDEVALTARTACIEAINSYRQEHGWFPLVVCSRQADYLAQSGRLLVRSAMAVQPLTQKQVDAYLAQGGEPLWALHAALRSDATLRELTSTPLMLSILTLTYHGKPVEELLRGTSLEERQRQIFEQYVKRMLTRRGPLKAGTPQQVVHWLTYLATRMCEHDQTVFYLEHLQPDWLDPMLSRSYAWLAIRLPALLVGILVSLVVMLVLGGADLVALLQFATLGGLLGWLFSRPTSARRSLPQQAGTHRRQGRRYFLEKDLPPSLIVGVMTGLSFGLHLGNGYGPDDWLRDGFTSGAVIGFSSLLLSWLLAVCTSTHSIAPKNNRRARRWEKLVHLVQTRHGQRAFLVIAIVGVGEGLSQGLSIELSQGLSIGLNPALRAGLSQGMAPGLGIGLSAGLGSGLLAGLVSVLVSLTWEAQAEGISFSERLQWTWNSLMRSLFSPKHMRVALLMASVIGIPMGLIDGLYLTDNGLSYALSLGFSYALSYALSFGLLYWILLGLFQGIESSRIEDHARRVPNQGIHLSLHNSMLMALISGGLISGIGTLSVGLSNWLGVGLSDWLSQGWLIRVNPGLINGWGLGVCGGLLIGIVIGGLATWRHGILRLLLRRAGAVPRHYVHFLDEAASSILLQKVGGGYSFIHRLLLEYFASLDTLPPPERVRAQKQQSHLVS
jgi:hypothetical protein